MGSTDARQGGRGGPNAHAQRILRSIFLVLP